MPQLRLLSPVNSIDSARVLVRLGTDEIYVGLDEPLKDGVFNFSGRPSTAAANMVKRVNPTFEELKKIVELCHQSGVQVNFAANTFMMADDPDGGKRFQQLYLDYVKRGLDAGVDAVIVGEITNMMAIRDVGIEAPMHASSFLSAWNPGSLGLLRELGCMRVCLPYQMTLSDLIALTAIEGLEYEFFGQFSCSNLVGQCRMMHNAAPGKPIPMPCRNTFNLSGGIIAENMPFLDAGLDCALCSLPELMKLNVHAIKTTGRDISLQLIAAVTKLYRDCIDIVTAGGRREEILQVIARAGDWQNQFCKKNRCSYLQPNRIENTYI